MRLKIPEMIKVNTKIYFEQADVNYTMVECPICGQKLTEVCYVKGVIALRVKCRRCKHYINVDIVGVDEK